MSYNLCLKLSLIPFVLLMVLLLAVPVQAIDLPDSTPTVEQIDVYRNLLEDGDRLFLIYANIPYASTPDIPVTQAFVWTLYDTDGTTELGSTTGYAYNESGYGYNVYSLYFAAADSITWGEAYPLKLKGNPNAFSSPPIYTYAVSAGDYTSYTATADNQTELSSRILELADDLDVKWGLTTDESLLDQLAMGPALSIRGEAFFRGAIYGLQALAPYAFALQVIDMVVEDREWGNEYAENLTGQYTGTWIETAQEAGKTLFSTEIDILSLIITLAMAIGVLIGNIMLSGNAWDGLVDASFVLIICSRLGFIYLGIPIVIAALCILYLGAKLIRMFVL